mgnify:CR=1 FL=1
MRVSMTIRLTSTKQWLQIYVVSDKSKWSRWKLGLRYKYRLRIDTKKKNSRHRKKKERRGERDPAITSRSPSPLPFPFPKSKVPSIFITNSRPIFHNFDTETTYFEPNALDLHLLHFNKLHIGQISLLTSSWNKHKCNIIH